MCIVRTGFPFIYLTELPIEDELLDVFHNEWSQKEINFEYSGTEILYKKTAENFGQKD